MRFFSKIISYLIILAALLFSACSGEDNSNQIQNQNADNGSNTDSNSVVAAKNDPAELSKIINLPIMPIEADWREDSAVKQTASNDRPPNANDRKMLAVLLYDPADTPKLLALIEKHKPAEAAEIEVESWFPAELIAQSQTSGNETVKGNAYAASDFLQSPYLNGRVIHISGTDYFILEFFTT